MSMERYSLTRYSVGAGGSEFAIEFDVSDSLKSVVGVAVPVSIRAIYADTISGKSQGTLSLRANLAGDNSLHTVAEMSANVVFEQGFDEQMKSTASGGKNFYRAFEVEDELSMSAAGCKNIPVPGFEPSDVVSNFTHGGKNVVSTLFASDSLYSLSGAISVSTETAFFEIVIPPGGEFRVDSEFYTALLDSENILHAQSGEWVVLSPELIRLTIETASGPELEGQLVYTERYL